MEPTIFERLSKYDTRIIVIKSRGENTWRAALEYFLQHSGGETNIFETAIGYNSPEEALEECEHKLNDRLEKVYGNNGK